MVFLGGDKKGEVATEMRAVNGGGEERSLKVPLHNFNLPSFLKWGNQRQLRCMKLPQSREGDGSRKTYDRSKVTFSPLGRRLKRSSTVLIGEEGIEAVREKIMLDLKSAAERMKIAIFREDTSMAHAETSDSDDYAAVRSVAEDAAKRWNLRTRKASSAMTAAGKNSDSSPVVVAGVPAVGAGVVFSGRKIAGGGGYDYSSPEKGERKREKFSVTLSKKEIEEDYVGIFGHRPPRRPKKRPRTVQRQLDALFPGLWLTEVSGDNYKVPEGLPQGGKR